VDTYAGRAMTVTTATKLLVAVVSMGFLAACGPGPQPQSETPAQIWHELVLCARTHGDPTFPDPISIDSQGRATFPANTQPPSDATKRACQSIYNRLPAAARNSAPPDIQMEIKFAQCMRQHGLTDWPDPNANGDYPLPPDLIATSKSGPLWERIRAGWDACRQFNPTGSISVSHN
jgi:hypothetical protein